MDPNQPVQSDPNAQASQPAQDQSQGQMAPFDIYEKLRVTILELLKQGLPGADQLLLSIDKIQAKNIGEAVNQGAGAQGGQAGVSSPQASSQYGQAPTQ